MANKRTFKFTLADVAAEIGKSIHTVRADRADGRFDPEDLRSLSKYVAGHLVVNEARKIDWGKK